MHNFLDNAGYQLLSKKLKDSIHINPSFTKPKPNKLGYC